MKRRKKRKILKYFNNLNRSLKENEKLWDLVVYVYSFLVFVPLFWYINKSGYEFLWLKKAVAEGVYFLLKISGVKVSLESVFLKTDYMVVEIIRDCTGWKSLFVLVVLMFVTPKVRWGYKVIGFLGAIPFVYVLSVLRIYSSMYAVGIYGVERFGFIHDVLWQVGLIVSVLGFWYLWMRYVLRK